MKEIINFYNPEEIKSQYPAIAVAYQRAFAGDPWFEVSKCADRNDVKRCISDFSKLEVGSICELCTNKTEQPAYNVEELTNKFDAIASTRPTAWYVENNLYGLKLAALAWTATAEQIFTEKYSDVPEMDKWLAEKLGPRFIWLDEVFADKYRQPTRNLDNFKLMCNGFFEQLSCSIIAFRTINPRMLRAARRDFDSNRVEIYGKNSKVPDRRDFVIIKQFGPELPSNGCGR